MSVFNKKSLSYTLLFCTALSAAGCGWYHKIYDSFFFEPNKWQDDVKIGPRRLPAENPGTAADMANKKAMAQKSGGPFAYPSQGGTAPAGQMGGMPPTDPKFNGKIPMPPRPPMPQSGNYPSPNDSFQPQSTKLPAWTKGMDAPEGDMPSPYGNPGNSGMNPSMPGQHMIRHYETMSNDVYMDGLKTVKPKDRISQAELPKLASDKKSMFVSDNYAPQAKKTDGKSMFPLEEYAPKSDVPVTSDKKPSFPKLTDVPKNPDEPFDKNKINAGIDSLVKELDNANAKRDAILKTSTGDNGKNPAPLASDNDAAALGITPKKATDTDSDVLKKAAPAAKPESKKKQANLNERRPVMGNIKAETEKKTPRFIGEEDKVSTNKFNDDLKAVLEPASQKSSEPAQDKVTPENPPAQSKPETGEISPIKPDAPKAPVKAKPLVTAKEAPKTTNISTPPPPIVTPSAPIVTVEGIKSTDSSTGLLPNSRYTGRRMGQ
jgi:hypothetical protein